ncbi:MAG: multicopper oxidase domain-containing protein [Halioglobus sp.]|nr:multicopper oxidase domain-containing protein [Halioglobus sp.]
MTSRTLLTLVAALAPGRPGRRRAAPVRDDHRRGRPGCGAQLLLQGLGRSTARYPVPCCTSRRGMKWKVVVQNNSTLNHTVHWHGTYQTGTWRSDGVPDITQEAIEPGESYTYRVHRRQAGHTVVPLPRQCA